MLSVPEHAIQQQHQQQHQGSIISSLTLPPVPLHYIPTSTFTPIPTSDPHQPLPQQLPPKPSKPRSKPRKRAEPPFTHPLAPIVHPFELHLPAPTCPTHPPLSPHIPEGSTHHLSSAAEASAIPQPQQKVHRRRHNPRPKTADPIPTFTVEQQPSQDDGTNRAPRTPVTAVKCQTTTLVIKPRRKKSRKVGTIAPNMMPVVETLDGESQQTQQPHTQPPQQQHTWLFFDDSFKGPLKPGSGYSVWNAAVDKDCGEGVPSFGSESVDEASSEEEGCDLFKLLSSNEFERVKPHLGQTKRDIFYDIFNVDIMEALGTELEPHLRPVHAPSRERRIRLATANQKAMESAMMSEDFRREEYYPDAHPIKRTRLETDTHQQFQSILIPNTFYHGYSASTTRRQYPQHHQNHPHMQQQHMHAKYTQHPHQMSFQNRHPTYQPQYPLPNMPQEPMQRMMLPHSNSNGFMGQQQAGYVQNSMTDGTHEQRPPFY